MVSPLPAKDVFWLSVQPHQLAFCIAHRDSIASKALWSNASSLGNLKPLSGLEYRERDDRHPEDHNLCQSLDTRACEHANQHFKRTLVNGIVAVGIAGAKKNRDRAARVAAAVTLALTSHDDKVHHACSHVWNEFPCLLEQANSCYPKPLCILPEASVFWRHLHQSNKQALCIAHTNGTDLWSSAMSMGMDPALHNLEYRESNCHHQEDDELLQALQGSPYANDFFTKSIVCNLVAVGIGSNQKNRQRAARVAAAVAHCIQTPDAVCRMKEIWADFPSLVEQSSRNRFLLFATVPLSRRPSTNHELPMPSYECYTHTMQTAPNSPRQDVESYSTVLEPAHIRSSYYSRAFLKSRERVPSKPKMRLSLGKRAYTDQNIDDTQIGLDCCAPSHEAPEGDVFEQMHSWTPSEEPSPITPPNHLRDDHSDDESNEDLDEEAKILRIVFRDTEYDDKEDIQALLGVLRLSLRRFRPVQCRDVKVEEEDGSTPHAKGEIEEDFPDMVSHRRGLLSVRKLKFTHDTVSPTFKDGGSFQDLMQDLRTGKVDPRTNLRPLKIYHWPGVGYYSRDNRRLKCLKEFQDEEPERDIHVRVNIFKLPAKLMNEIAGSPKLRNMLTDFLLAYSTRNDGQSVQVRTRRFKRQRHC